MMVGSFVAQLLSVNTFPFKITATQNKGNKSENSMIVFLNIECKTDYNTLDAVPDTLYSPLMIMSSRAEMLTSNCHSSFRALQMSSRFLRLLYLCREEKKVRFRLPVVNNSINEK